MGMDRMMRGIAGSGWLGAALVVAFWRGASEFIARVRSLAREGVLEQRVAARRAARIQRALARAGLPMRVAELVPVVATAGAMVDRTVHVGRVGSVDHDDVGLLEAAMRRAARERMGVDAGRIARRAYDQVDWATLLAEPEAAGRHGGRGAGIRDFAPVLLAGAGVALTIVPLVRPLAGAAPWLALAGGALVLAAWVATRRS